MNTIFSDLGKLITFLAIGLQKARFLYELGNER
jgi:hypothetical protein